MDNFDFFFRLLPCFGAVSCNGALLLQESGMPFTTLSSGKEKKIQSLVSEYVFQAKKRRDV
jgi:hypothetical protein